MNALAIDVNDATTIEQARRRPNIMSSLRMKAVNPRIELRSIPT
jgi:hypothetical protein